MFSSIVFVCLMFGLFISGGAALHMGIFKAHRPDKSLAVKTLSGIFSYAFSAVFWFFCYSHHYMGW